MIDAYLGLKRPTTDRARVALRRQHRLILIFGDAVTKPPKVLRRLTINRRGTRSSGPGGPLYMVGFAFLRQPVLASPILGCTGFGGARGLGPLGHKGTLRPAPNLSTKDFGPPRAQRRAGWKRPKEPTGQREPTKGSAPMYLHRAVTSREPGRTRHLRHALRKPEGYGRGEPLEPSFPVYPYEPFNSYDLPEGPATNQRFLSGAGGLRCRFPRCPVLMAGHETGCKHFFRQAATISQTLELSVLFRL